MKTLTWKPYLAGFALYFLATRPLLAYVLPGAPILLGGETEPSTTLLWATFLWHVIAACAAGFAAAALARGAELAVAGQLGVILAIVDGVRAIRNSQDPGERPGILFLFVLLVAVIAACTAGGWLLAGIRRRNRP